MDRKDVVLAATLIEDWDFYPRASVDPVNVSNLVHALEAGVQLPPVIADRASKRLVDGWHRRQAHLKHYGPTAEIDVVWRDYATEAEMYEDAVGLNSDHGRQFTTHDCVRITNRMEQLGVTHTRVAILLHRPERVINGYASFVAHNEDGDTIPLKRPMRRFAGKTLTRQQEIVNRHSSGWSVGYHAQQIINHLEADTVELTPQLIVTLEELRDVLIGLNIETRGSQRG